MCTSPLFRIDEKIVYANGIRNHFSKIRNKGILFGSETFDYWFKFYSDDDIQRLPCGQCLECRLAYSSTWATRCMLESEAYPYNYFVTLTYSDDFLPRGDFLDYDGIVKESTLSRRDVQLFMKNLRRLAEERYGHTGIRVFYSGEYGDLFDRPHYHLILFNMPDLTDGLKFLRKEGNMAVFTHDLIYDAWQDFSITRSGISRGFHSIGTVTFDSCAYVARYCIKKRKGNDVKAIMQYSDEIDIRAQPFVGMSLKPGIARDYFEKHKDSIYESDSVLYSSQYRAFRAKPPRYFDKLYDVCEPELSAELRARRAEAGIDARAAKRDRLGMTDFEINKMKEGALKSKEERRKKGCSSV